MQLLKKYSVNFLLIVFALQILNMSMHARPMGGDLLIDESAGNPADHAIEYLVETVFHVQDAFPEDQNSRHHQTQSHKTVSFKIFPCSNDPLISASYEDVVFSSWPPTDENSYSFAIEINPPPPKA